MALKKSDKIIAIVGVIILIVAAVGIFLYADLEEEETPKDDEGEMKIFEIHYDEVLMPAVPDNQDYSIKAKLLRKGSYKGVVEINQQNPSGSLPFCHPIIRLQPEKRRPCKHWRYLLPADNDIESIPMPGHCI